MGIKLIRRFAVDSWKYRRYINVYNMFVLFCAEHFWKRGRIVQIKVKHLLSAVHVRAKTSDCALIRNMLLKNGSEYPIFSDYSPNVIIDAGANIGLSAVFFKTHYPDVTVIAIEPDRENCNIFELNTMEYRGIHLLVGGVWPDANTKLRILNPEKDENAYQLQEAPDGVNAYTISGICAQFGISHIDILKLDIEGSERELLSRNIEWLDMTENIFIELHDRFAPGASQALLRACAGREFYLGHSGENLILTKSLHEWRRI